MYRPDALKIVLTPKKVVQIKIKREVYEKV